MKRFALFVDRLLEAPEERHRVIIDEHLRALEPEDRLWTVYLLTGQWSTRVVKSSLLRDWACELARVPLWLFEESRRVTSDSAEASALIVPEPVHLEVDSRSLAEWMEEISTLRVSEEPALRTAVEAMWRRLPPAARVVLNKVLCGTFHPPARWGAVVEGFASVLSVPAAILAHRLLTPWTPTRSSYDLFAAPSPLEERTTLPYPFHLAQSVEHLSESDPSAAWLAEWKWNGVRAQLVVRGGDCFVWSRAGELVSDRFPELRVISQFLPDGTVLDGQIIACDEEGICSVPLLEKRIQRGSSEVPIRFYAYDLLELAGRDVRARPLSERRALLEGAIEALPDALMTLSPTIPVEALGALDVLHARARAIGAAGVVLKHRDSAYRSGREESEWLKWKLDRFQLDAVLLYAERVAADGALLVTLGVWSGDRLVPVAKVSADTLDEAEVEELAAFVRENTIERFGPVRTVEPELVFRLTFGAITPSKRRKSGFELRDAAIASWLRESEPEDAASIDALSDLFDQGSPGRAAP